MSVVMLISAGIRAPVECELGVAKLFAHIKARFGSAISELQTVQNEQTGYPRSVLFASNDEDVLAYAGTVRWVWESELRPGHKRKNWYISCQACRLEDNAVDFDPDKVRIETMRSSGPGGQHVNKTESAVRAHFAPLGLTVVIADERSQQANRKRAMACLQALVALHNAEQQKVQDKDLWRQKNSVERGNEDLVFFGRDFVPKGGKKS